MDSFLRDSSGLSYNREFINQISEERILDLAHKAGNYMDFWAVRFLPGRKFLSEMNTTLTELTEEIVSISEELKKKIRDNRKIQDLEVNSSFLSSLRITPKTEGKLVGLEKDLIMMLDSLTGQPSQLKVFPIIGMGGIGKTTFSKKLYDHPLVVHHFYIRVWVTVSQQYQVREMLLGVLRCIANVSDEIYGRSDGEIREQVYRSLKGKRYLIVLDDMWDTKAWDDLRRTFPDDQNGSRIMLTSRLREVAVHASQDTPPLCLRCLSMDESWELLSSNIFGDESCLLELVEIGKQIAYKCQGLPLAIVVVGGLLSKMSKRLEVWEEVAQSVGSLVMEEAEHFQNILALSYHHLPDQLKACFLYMGLFPEDYEISVKKLLWLWIAEGFIRPSILKSLEEVAEEYLEDLTTRSLILVKKKGSNGRVKTCYIHDMMRELCLRESKKQNFLHVINSCEQLPLMNLDCTLLPRSANGQVSLKCLHNLRRLSFHSSTRKYSKGFSPYTRSVICFEKLSFSDPRTYFGMQFGLLKVLDLMNIHQSRITPHIKNLTLLKFVALIIEDSRDIMFLFTLRSLQTLILDCEWDGHLPLMFWNMLELRHFHLTRSCLSHSPRHSLSPSTSALEPVDPRFHLRVLNNLRSVSTIRPISCTVKNSLHAPFRETRNI